MFGYRRLKLAQLRVWLRRQQDPTDEPSRPPRWLGAWRGVRCAARITRERAASWLTPHWLQSSTEFVCRNLGNVEARVTATRHQIAQALQCSVVGTGARRLSRVGRLLEFRLAVLIVAAARWLGRALTALVPDPLRRRLAHLGSGLSRRLDVLGAFLGHWFHTRQYVLLIGGLPAVLFALPLVYCAVSLPFYGQAAKAQRYRRAAQEALQAKDLAAANLYYRKLTQLGT